MVNRNLFKGRFKKGGHGLEIFMVTTLVILAVAGIVIPLAIIFSRKGKNGTSQSAGIQAYFAPLKDAPQCSLYDSTIGSDPKKRATCIMGSGVSSNKNLTYEVQLINTIATARMKDKNSVSGQTLQNPYRIRYSVYNLMSPDIITALVNAIKAKVYVQILIETSQTDPCKTYLQGLKPFAKAFSNSGNAVCWKPINNPKQFCDGGAGSSCKWDCANGLAGATTCAGSSGNYESTSWLSGGQFNNQPLPIKSSGESAKVVNTNPAPTQWYIPCKDLETVFMVPILSMNCQQSSSPYAGIMHTKMRLLEWPKNRVVISGSLNPDQSAFVNDETLLIMKNLPVFDDYAKIYNSILHFNNRPNSKQYTFTNKPLNLTNNSVQLFFSKGNVSSNSNKYVENSNTIGKNLVELITKEREMVLIFVYTMRDFGGLVAAIQQAAKNGAFVMVMTDLDQIVGELGFSGPEPYCLFSQINSILLSSRYGKKVYVPVYACKNNNGPFNAFHHKNMILGATNMLVTTDTANWTAAAVGIGSTKKPTGLCYSCTNCLGLKSVCQDKDLCKKSGSKWGPKSPNISCETYTPPSSDDCSTWETGNGNLVSTVKNCETTLFINSKKLDNNKLGNSFASVYMYLIKKYWVFTETSICTMTHPVIDSQGNTTYQTIYCPKGASSTQGIQNTSSSGPSLACSDKCKPLHVITGCYKPKTNTLQGNAELTAFYGEKDNKYKPKPEPQAPQQECLCGQPAYEEIPNMYSPAQIGIMMLNIPNLKNNTSLYQMVKTLSTCQFPSDPKKNFGTC